MKRKISCWLIVGFIFLAFLGSTQAAQKYPTRTVELMLGQGPGGTNDIVARTYSEELSRTLKVPVTIVNRPGGGGIEATLYVARAKKNGYTLLSASGAMMVVAPIITPEATYDTLRDFTPLGYFGKMAPSLFVVRSDSPFKTLRDVVEYARKNPGKLKCAVGSIGTAGYNNLRFLMSTYNITMGIVPFKGGGESTIASLGGHVDLNCGGIANFGPHIKAGKLRGLAVVGDKRLPSYPDIPTTVDAGYPAVNYCEGIGIFGPAGLPNSVLNVLLPAVEKAFKNPQVVARALALDFTPEYKNSADYRKFIESQRNIWGKAYKEAGLSVR